MQEVQVSFHGLEETTNVCRQSRHYMLEQMRAYNGIYQEI